jgi:DNA-binding transcriptional regulator YbjK
MFMFLLSFLPVRYGSSTYQRYAMRKQKENTRSIKRNKTTRKRSSREKRAKYTLHNAHTIFSEKKSLMKIYDFVNV